jgi:hypothetical protein
MHKNLQKSRASANGTSSSNGSSGSSKAKGGTGAKSSSSNSKSSGVKAGRSRVQPVVVPDGCLEGTRLTLVSVPNQPDAVEFSIRCVPGRHSDSVRSGTS